jgi:hypothetical protein
MKWKMATQREKKKKKQGMHLETNKNIHKNFFSVRGRHLNGDIALVSPLDGWILLFFISFNRSFVFVKGNVFYLFCDVIEAAIIHKMIYPNW